MAILVTTNKSKDFAEELGKAFTIIKVGNTCEDIQSSLNEAIENLKKVYKVADEQKKLPSARRGSPFYKFKVDLIEALESAIDIEEILTGKKSPTVITTITKEGL